MPFTSGLISRQDVVATVDCPPVAQLKRVGAIPLGVTNTSELCMWLESNNHLHGITNNPYDTERIAGGSSGELDTFANLGVQLHFFRLTVTVTVFVSRDNAPVCLVMRLHWL